MGKPLPRLQLGQLGMKWWCSRMSLNEGRGRISHWAQLTGFCESLHCLPESQGGETDVILHSCFYQHFDLVRDRQISNWSEPWSLSEHTRENGTIPFPGRGGNLGGGGWGMRSVLVIHTTASLTAWGLCTHSPHSELSLHNCLLFAAFLLEETVLSKQWFFPGHSHADKAAAELRTQGILRVGSFKAEQYINL